MRHAALFAFVICSLGAAPAVATKPTPPITGKVELSTTSPRAGESLGIRLTFAVNSPLKNVRVRIRSQGRDSGKPCLEAAPYQEPRAIASLVPGSDYVIASTAAVIRDSEVCDVLIEPVASFGSVTDGMGMVFSQPLFEKPRQP